MSSLLKRRVKVHIGRGTKEIYKRIFRLIGFSVLPGIRRDDSKDGEYIVSLTSWEPRFDVLPVALKSILLQIRRPDRVILYLGSDVDPEKVPPEVRRFEEKGVEIRFVEENLRAHKKYYYAMEEFPDSTIITVDDDVIYSPFTISSLIRTSRKYRDCVCARKTRRMTFLNGKLMPYNDWRSDETDDVPCYDLMGTGVGGILYPPHCLHGDLFDKKALQEVAFSNDDLWLKGMELLQGTKTKSVDCFWSHPIPLIKDDEFALYNTNVLDNENDRALRRLQDRYPEVFDRCAEGASVRSGRAE